MNIIEQLGYEAAKNYAIDANACGAFDDEKRIKSALLEYRRQHNIFEAGDWIVIDSYKPEYQFYQITEDDMGSHWINLVEFRHATPEEIAAGKRL